MLFRSVVALKDIETIDSKIDIVVSAVPPETYADEGLLQAVITVLKQQPLVDDIAVSKAETRLLQIARKMQCSVMDAMPMFYHQAAIQQKFWR